MNIKIILDHILNDNLNEASNCLDVLLHEKISNKINDLKQNYDVLEGEVKDINKQHRKEIEKELGSKINKSHVNYSSSDTESGRKALKILPQKLLNKLVDKKKANKLTMLEQSVYKFDYQKRIRDISKPHQAMRKNIVARSNIDKTLKNTAKKYFGKVKI